MWQRVCPLLWCPVWLDVTGASVVGGSEESGHELALPPTFGLVAHGVCWFIAEPGTSVWLRVLTPYSPCRSDAKKLFRNWQLLPLSLDPAP